MYIVSIFFVCALLLNTIRFSYVVHVHVVDR